MNSVVLFTVDCLRADHVGCYGYDRDTTPNIDSIAREGTRYEYAYSNGPGTRFAFKSLCGGTLPLEMKGAGLPRTAGKTVAEMCADNGYRTAAFSYNPFLTTYFNYQRGFDRFDDLNNWDDDEGTTATAKTGLRRLKEGVKTALPRGPVYRVAKTVYERAIGTLQSRDITVRVTDDDVVDRALSWLSDAKDDSRPFFLWIHLMDAHAPFRYLPEHLEAIDAPQSYDRHVRSPWDEFEYGTELPQRVLDTYDANIRSADEAIGRVVDALDDHTTIAVTGDHGEEFGTHSTFHTVSVYESMARVPIIVHGPEFDADVSRTPVSHVDIPPTIADVTDGTPHDTWTGESLLTLAQGDRRQVLINYEKPDEIAGAVVDPPWKYRCVQQDIDAEPTDETLLNFERDPDEQTDYATANSEVFASLQSQWQGFLEDVNEYRLDSEHGVWDEEGNLNQRIATDGEDEDISESVTENLERLGYLE